MHRYREFGLVSDQDEQLRRAFRDGMRRAGLSFSQHLDALAWYRDQARAGRSEDDLVAAFAAFASDHDWSVRDRDSALDTYRAIRDNGAESVVTPQPHRELDRATLAEGERLLRVDPARYWRDGELQDRLFEARERLGAATEARAQGETRDSDPDRQRIEEIEAMLRDPSGAGQRRYWNSATLRAEYASALERVNGGVAMPESALPAAATAAATDAAAMNHAPTPIDNGLPSATPGDGAHDKQF